MIHFDLAISYKWEYDEEFVNLIEEIFQKDGLKTFIIRELNLPETIELLKKKRLNFKAYLDRASDEDQNFVPISNFLSRRKCYIINPHNKTKRIVDKSRMHKKLVKRKFQLPQTIVLPPFSFHPQLPIEETQINDLRKPFIIKPSLISGGGEGVIRNASSLLEIQEERKRNRSEKYLVQEKIYPRIIGTHRAWFRVFWAFDKAIPTWWDDRTHIYNCVTQEEIKKHNLLSLIRITARLARITKLDYFSTEIALTKEHKFVLIDYVNDQCDMRLKSNHPDGIPDDVVIELIESMKKKIITL